MKNLNELRKKVRNSLNKYPRATKVFIEDGCVNVSYHNTDVCVIQPIGANGYGVTLDTNGWQTPTTKKRMNDVLSGLGFGNWGVYQKNHVWFVNTGDRWGKNDRTEYRDGMQLVINNKGEKAVKK